MNEFSLTQMSKSLFELARRYRDNHNPSVFLTTYVRSEQSQDDNSVIMKVKVLYHGDEYPTGTVFEFTFKDAWNNGNWDVLSVVSVLR